MPQMNWQFKQEERRVGNFTSWCEDLGTQGNGEDGACYYLKKHFDSLRNGPPVPKSLQTIHPRILGGV
jgi:hypothetical protein